MFNRERQTLLEKLMLDIALSLVQLSLTAGLCEEAVSHLWSKEATGISFNFDPVLNFDPPPT